MVKNNYYKKRNGKMLKKRMYCPSCKTNNLRETRKRYKSGTKVYWDCFKCGYTDNQFIKKSNVKSYKKQSKKGKGYYW